MKNLLITFLTLLSLPSFGGYSKPVLLARLNDVGAWNAPDNVWCFDSEPAIIGEKVYLGCFDAEGSLMAEWGPGFKILARPDEGRLFSHPLASFGQVAWDEHDEISVQRSYQLGETLVITDVKNLSSFQENSDSFYPLGGGAWFYRIKSESPEIRVWNDHENATFFNPGAAYIYTPQAGPQGEIAFKTRDGNFRESSPDRIWLFHQTWTVVLEDRDANPSSPWLSFRHQLSVYGKRLAVIAKDEQGEALIEIRDGKTNIIARTGVDLASFDFFTPQLNQDTIVVRGVDFKGRKAFYVHDREGFRPLLTEGDIIRTDRGPGRVFYKNPDALFYGSPAIGPGGEIVLQATLTDPDYPSTLLGVGLIKIQK